MATEQETLKYFTWNESTMSWSYSGNNLEHMKKVVVDEMGGQKYNFWEGMNPSNGAYWVELGDNVQGPGDGSWFGASTKTFEEAWRYAIGTFFLPDSFKETNFDDVTMEHVK